MEAIALCSRVWPPTPSQVAIEPETSSVTSRLVCTRLRSAQRDTQIGAGESSRMVTSSAALLVAWPSWTCTPIDSVTLSSVLRTGWSIGPSRSTV